MIETVGLSDQAQLLSISLIVLAIYMSLWFVVARARRRLDTVDPAWGGAFIAVALTVALLEPNRRTWLVAVLVLIWGSRLFLYLFKRSRSGHEDPRYVKMTESWKRPWLQAYFKVFLLQGLLAGVISLPVVMASGEVLRPLAWLFTLGYVVWVVGFYVEYKADQQLADFKRQAAGKGAVLDTGLWRYSRHPNYFGELLQWWGIGLIALQTAWGWLGLLGPLLLTLLLRYVSGVPTVEKPKADDPAYQAYKRRTPGAIIPWFVDDELDGETDTASTRVAKPVKSKRRRKA